jgi:hypothetical protein
LHYGWGFAVAEMLRSRRLSPAGKVGIVMSLAAVIAPVVLATELFWVLTGRGRRLRRLMGGDVIVVVPRGARPTPDYWSAIASAREPS